VHVNTCVKNFPVFNFMFVFSLKKKKNKMVYSLNYCSTSTSAFARFFKLGNSSDEILLSVSSI